MGRAEGERKKEGKGKKGGRGKKRGRGREGGRRKGGEGEKEGGKMRGGVEEREEGREERESAYIIIHAMTQRAEREEEKGWGYVPMVTSSRVRRDSTRSTL